LGAVPSSNSPTYDLSLHLGTNGRVNLGVRGAAGALVTTTSQQAVNDGQWHHLVGVVDASGASLVVDGRRSGRSQAAVGAVPFAGYWRVLGDTTTGLANRPNDAALNGSVDEVAVYPAALPLDRIQARYQLVTGQDPTPAAPTDTYGTRVRADRPDSYWRLGETSGSRAADSSSSGVDGALAGVSVYGVAGAVTGTTDTALTLNGSSGHVVAAQAWGAPTTYSTEAWFRSTTTRGGRIIGFGSSGTSALSSSYDRMVCMRDDGKLSFGTYPGTQQTVVTPAAYNDGQWHHVVATQGPEGMRLYVDGVERGANSATSGASYTGFWRAGGDRCWGGTTSSYFAGSLDEVAVYPRVLDTDAVARHYAAGGGALPNQAPTAAFTSSATYLSASVDAATSADLDGTVTEWAWDFGDGGTATGATASHTYAAAGTYTVTLVVTDDKGLTGTTTRQVTVRANEAPTASFTHTENGRELAVDGSGSTDPEGAALTYAWDFGDGETGTGATAGHTYAADGTYTVRLTVTDAGGESSSSTASVTVVADPALARDAFGRTVTGGWGQADKGGAWTLSGTTSRYAVDGNAGTVALTAGTGARAALTAVSSTDTEVALEVATDKAATGGGQYVSLIGRAVAGGPEYRGKLLLASSGAVTAYVARVEGGVETTLGSATVAGLTHTAGGRLEVRLQVTGTAPSTVRVKVWAHGQAEPAGWTVSRTDSTAALQGPGSVGLYSYLSASATNAPVAFRVDDLWAGPPRP
jgi:trimeric autotransporter adhesin